MGRETDRERVRQINDCVEQHPGVRPAEIARQLAVPRSSVTRALPALEEQDQAACKLHGVLLFRDLVTIIA